ncbi:MAG TPA: hypothetical protein VMB51_09200 [Solirubrobacteraceae bacterium]|nr:hypothetical protein [Solirubrobacteraceae bacterium]
MQLALVVSFGVLILAGLAGAARANAAPLWRLSSRAAPTNLAPGSTGLLVVTAMDLGDSGVNAQSSPVTLTDTLPEGLVVSGGVSGLRAHRTYPVTGEAEEAAYWSCAVPSSRTVSCATTLDIPAFEGLEIMIPVEATDPAGTVASLVNELSVSGGVGAEEHGAAVVSASLARAVHVSAAPVPFGVEEHGYVLSPENDGGSVDALAGSHPYQLTATVNFNETLETSPVAEGEPAVKGLEPAAPALAKDLSFSLPPGLLGAVAAVEQCPEADFSALGPENVNLCPARSAVGVADVTINVPKPFGYHQFAVPLFNLVPAPGEPARFGFEIEKVPVELDTAVRTGGDYGVTVSVNEASELGQILGSQVTFWGVPDDPRHDPSRGWACLLGGLYTHDTQPCEHPSQAAQTAFLSLPGSCAGTLGTLMAGDSWEDETLPGTAGALADPLGEPIAALTECAALPFTPTIGTQALDPAEAGRAQSTVSAASTPTGLGATVTVPQVGTLDPQGVDEAEVREAKVTLPAGMLVSPSAANGLQACSEQQVGYEGPGSPNDPLAPGAGEPAHFSSTPVTCPAASTIGTVRVKTPLLGEQLSGFVYLAAQQANPFGSLLALYIVAENERLGLRVKLAGEAKADPQTGQLTTTFQNTPQVPFEELQLQLFGGPRAPLTTPPLCGQYQTSASFTPWSTGTPFDTSSPQEELIITSGAENGACQDPQTFAPTLEAGATSLQAGAYTNFTLQLTRPDGQQALTGLTVHLPPGSAAILKALTPCPEPQAAQGTCGQESEIGQATAYAGLGPDPYRQTGHVYLTGPYQGAPFGLSIATPAVAGPFDLGTVVVRSQIEVNPHTAAVTITSGLPTIVQGVGMAPSGIPLQLKQIDVQIDRPDFEYDPTNCTRAAITATLTGSEGASHNAAVPFQVSGCASLPFKPGVSASTQGRTSKADGASLGLVFRSKAGEAHVAQTILTIPSTLPARLTTIQKACVASVFEANPAACPEGSDIGAAVVHTPVLKSPLTGPIYLVSHGNAAWPDADLVLQGEGVTVILDGQTAIKKGVTTSSFLSVPDAPFESVEAILPEGPHSALTTNLPLKDHYSLCGQRLAIPTALTGQNGTAVNYTVKVAVQGCSAVRAAKVKKLTRKQKLALALAACRRRYKHSGAKLAACTRRARRRSHHRSDS